MLPQHDDYRKKFFEDFLRIEKEKEQELKRKQRNCFHTFHIIDGNIECAKCGTDQIDLKPKELKDLEAKDKIEKDK